MKEAYKNKATLIKEILSFSKDYKKNQLNKLKVDDVRNIYNQLFPPVVREPVKRHERVIRNFSDDEISESEEEKEEETKNAQQPVVQNPVVTEKPVVQQEGVVQQHIQALPLKMPNKPKVKQLSVAELRKVIRTKFCQYNKNISLIVKEFQQNLINDTVLIDDYNLLRDDFVAELNDYLDTQKKISDVQYSYINSLLERAAAQVEKVL